MTSKIHWCIQKKRGIKFIEPNDNLSEEYYSTAEETLRIANQIKDSGSNMWLATQKYYTEYFAAYALLMKIGIKSEMHSCTIEVIKLLEEEKLVDFDFTSILNKDKQLRIDNQYYLKNRSVELDSKKLAELLLRIRKVLDEIDMEIIKKLRKKINML